MVNENAGIPRLSIIVSKKPYIFSLNPSKPNNPAIASSMFKKNFGMIRIKSKKKSDIFLKIPSPSALVNIPIRELNNSIIGRIGAIIILPIKLAIC